MVRALIIEPQPSVDDPIISQLEEYCPQVEVVGQTTCLQDVPAQIVDQTPDVLFVDLDVMAERPDDLFDELSLVDFRTIIVSRLQQYALQAIRNNSAGYLLKPLRKTDVLAAVAKVEREVEDKKRADRQLSLLESLVKNQQCNELIGVPSVKGYDYLAVEDIVCCEGLQKCTRIVTTNKTNIVSSYNLGHFRKMLEPFRFFSPHRSYLINLRHVKQYCREGVIHMAHDIAVPVAKRHKEEFLSLLLHL